MDNEIPIPKRTLRSLELYRDERVPTGGFLLALRSIVHWINWELFAKSWGSYGAVDDWLAEEEYEPRP